MPETLEITIGQKWRVKRGLQPVLGANAPRVGTVCQVWQVTPRRVYLLGDGHCFDISTAQVPAYFEEVTPC